MSTSNDFMSVPHVSENCKSYLIRIMNKIEKLIKKLPITCIADKEVLVFIDSLYLFDMQHMLNKEFVFKFANENERYNNFTHTLGNTRGWVIDKSPFYTIQLINNPECASQIRQIAALMDSYWCLYMDDMRAMEFKRKIEEVKQELMDEIHRSRNQSTQKTMNSLLQELESSRQRV